MRVYNKGNVQVNNKRNIYLDVDDVVIKSTWQIIDMILRDREQREGKPFNHLTREKNFKSLNMKSFDPEINKDKLGMLYDSERFFKEVEFNEKLIKGLRANNEYIFNNFNWSFVSKGSNINHIRKCQLLYNHPFFSKHVNEIPYYGLSMEESKSKIFMMNGIQIDDMSENLVCTDASVKILLKNEVDTDFNQLNTYRNQENFYVVDNTTQLIEILEFFVHLEEIGEEDLIFEGIDFL